MTITLASAAVVGAAVLGVPALTTLTASAAALGPVTIYPASAVPANNVGVNEATSVELGVKFKPSVAGTITALRFYKSTRNTGIHTGTLWSSTGKKLASIQFDNETASGWQSMKLTTPVAITAGTTYTASYLTRVGYYSYQDYAFNNGSTMGNSYLTATSGTYRYGWGGYPTQAYNRAAYYVDVEFAPGTTAPAALPPATTSAAAPAPSTSKVSSSAAPTSSAPASTTSAPAPSTSKASSSASATSAPATSSSAPAPAPTTSAPASTTGFPDATNTGVPAGTVLKTVPGQVTSGTGWHWDGTRVVIDANSTTLSGLDINGAIMNSKTGLVVKNSKVRCTNESNWCVEMGAGSTLTDTEIGGGANGTTYLGAIGVLSGYWKSSQAANLIQRVHIHHTIHGMRVDGDTTVVDSFIHDFPMGDAPYTDAHTDGIMCTAGANVIIRHNHFEHGNTSTFFVQWQSGNAGINNYLLENNLFVGISKNGQLSSYGVMIENKGISGPVTVRNNTFTGTWQAGQILAPKGASVTGNVTGTGGAVKIEYQ